MLKRTIKDAMFEGYCPNPKEVANAKVKEVSKRLKGETKKETLTNISEWHNNNFYYWYERQTIALCLAASFAFSLFLIYILCLLRNSQYLGFLWSTVFVSTSITITLLFVNVLMFSYHRKLPLRQFSKIFSFSISMDFLLEKRLAICRDYAKMAASLLFNIYPESDVYFVKAPSHVATGIKIDKKLYVIDKHLPLATLEKWHQRWHTGRFSNKQVEVVKGTCLESTDLYTLIPETRFSSSIDTNRLAKEMEVLVGIRKSTSDANADLVIIYKWIKGAILYEDDEVVNYSIARRLKQRILSEIIDLNRVVNIKVYQNKDDLVFWVSLGSAT